MKLLYRIFQWLFPAKCVLCRKLLEKEETHLCRSCRIHVPTAPAPQKKLPYLDRWTAVWYYNGNVRRSILGYKFYGKRSYARAYGAMVAMALANGEMTDFDILTWVPASALRRLRRGYDQAQLLAQAVAEELGREATPTLKKIRHNSAQSGIAGESARRANVLGAYRLTDPAALAGKRVLLLDDVVTTGATACECARMLRSGGASSVHFAAVARRHEITKKNQ